MIRIYPKVLSFSKLKSNLYSCLYAIPQVQRNYVWDKNRVCLLLDSIYNHYPIGVSLVWKAKSSRVAEMKPNNKTILPALSLNRKTIDFIIDGQQRISSLYGLIEGLNKEIDFNSNIDFNSIYFSLNKKDEQRFLYLARYDSTRNEYIQVTEILKVSTAYLKYRHKLNNSKCKEIQKLKTRIKAYRFHFLYIETDSLDEVRETFVRINSQGMTIGKADALFARTTNIALRDLVDNTRRALKARGYDRMKPESLIYVLPLSKGEKKVGRIALESFIKKFNNQKQFKTKFQKDWKRYHKAFLNTVDFLAGEFGVSSYVMLPSDNIFTMLSLFFYHNNARPTTVQKKEIKKWFWHTAIGERYSGSAFNRNIPLDIRFFTKLAKRKNYKYPITEKINATEFLKKDYRRIRFSAVLGYYLFLKQLKPKYLEAGYPMMIDNTLSPMNRRDRHHIFPSAILGRKRITSKWKNSLVNICFLAANENQSINDDYPRIYLSDFKRKRFFKSVMRSHLIPVHSNSGIWESDTRRGFKSFLNERARFLIRNLAKAAGVKPTQLFEKFDEINRV